MSCHSIFVSEPIQAWLRRYLRDYAPRPVTRMAIERVLAGQAPLTCGLYETFSKICRPLASEKSTDPRLPLADELAQLESCFLY